MQIKLRLYGRPIAFYPELAKIFGSIERALYIQQLYFWSDKGKRKDGFFFKTKKEIEEETTLSRYQQDACRKYFERIGILKTKIIKANGIPTLHYFINFKKFQEFLDEHPDSKKLTNGIARNSLSHGIARNSLSGWLETSDSLTEITTENTHIKKNNIKKKEKSRRASTVPPNFKPTDKLLVWAKEKGYTLDLAAETEMFVDYYTAKGTKYKDWGAAWRNWIRRAAKHKESKHHVQVETHYKPLIVD